MNGLKHEFGGSDETQVLPLHKFATTANGQASPEGMTQFIKKAAEEVVAEGGQSIVLPRDSGALPPATMLGAVTYCYAHDVYESERIVQKFSRDETLKSTIGVDLPAPGAIRRFRKLNRSMILSILERALLLQRRELLMKPDCSEETIFLTRAQAEKKLELASLLDRPT